MIVDIIMETTACSSTDSAGSLGLWLGKPAPRYTSYPPAPFFNTGITSTDYIQSLSSLQPDDFLSIYIHIPFCRSLCLYCGCNTTITHRTERIQGYLALLKKEIGLVAAYTGRRQVGHLHFGGGTPNILSNQDIHALINHLRESFDLGSVNEIAMELDPRVVTRDQIKNLAICGVTRISLGIQDFDPEVQAIVHRHQPHEMVEEVCGWLRDAEIHHINFDLMYGLPKQTPETVADMVNRACRLKPDRIALFSYAHVPQMKKHQKVLESFGLPDVYQRIAMDQIGRSILLGEGYHAIGIDHFARAEDNLIQAWCNGKVHRNFQGYTEDNAGALLGFGASSISQTHDGYFQNEFDEDSYEQKLKASELPIRRGFILSPEDRLRRAIIEQLMCTLSCDIGAVCGEYGYRYEDLAEEIAQLKPFEDAGIIMRRGRTVCLASPHRMAVRVICRIFDSHTRSGERILSSLAA